MRAGDLAEIKRRKEERRELERKQREDEEYEQLTFKPQLGRKSKRLANERQERSNSNFLAREQQFLQERENKRN